MSTSRQMERLSPVSILVRVKSTLFVTALYDKAKSIIINNRLAVSVELLRLF